MHPISSRTILVLTFVLTALILQNAPNVALAQGGQQNNQNNQSNHQNGGQQANNKTSSAQPSNNTTTNNKTVTAGQNGNQTNITSTAPSSTPITFPLAPLPSSGPLAGTYQAPFPAEGQGQNGQSALGPDDNYIAAAVALLPTSAVTLQILCTFAFIILAGATLL